MFGNLSMLMESSQSFG